MELEIIIEVGAAGIFAEIIVVIQMFGIESKCWLVHKLH